MPLFPSNKLPPGFIGGGFLEEFKEDSNMITFEVTDNMLAKVSHDFLTLSGSSLKFPGPIVPSGDIRYLNGC